MGLREPIQVRKELLGCAKDVIGGLKRYERFKDLRKEKAEAEINLKRLFDEMTVLSNRLRNMLPKTKLRAVSQGVPEEKGVQIKEIGPRQRSGSVLDKLEQELAQLESKLTRIK
ncbi:MAG: hypothetical protein ABIF10_06640 [Candidatus Woesearchaeota archaeon]